MHMTLAAPQPKPHADTGLDGWLNALSRLGLGLDAGLMAMTADAPAERAESHPAPNLPAIPPATH